MNCPKCQNPIAPNARFCGTCGQAIPAAPDAAQTPPPADGNAPGASGPAAGTSAGSAPPAGVPALPELLQRIKGILLSPLPEWGVIAGEPTVPAQLFTGYVAPLVAFAAVISFIHLSLIGVSLPFGGSFRTPLFSGLVTAVLTVVFGITGVFLIGLIINGLAPTFGGSRDLRQALKVSAYSLTPALLGAVLALSPVLPSLLQLAAGCYGIYILFLGLPVLMRAPQERAVGYTATVVICTLLVGVVLSVASMGLGLAGHTGLMGRQEADREQGAAAAASVIGGALGTNEQGRAALATALNNLAKAGEQNQAAAAPGDAAANATAASTGTATTAQNPAAAVGGLMNALGGAMAGDHPVAAVDFHSLTALLPPSLPGMTRSDARGESQTAMGMKTATATGTYRGDNGAGIQVVIADMSAVSGLMNLAGAMVQNTSSESTTGFEKDQSVGGRTVHEKYDIPGKHGVLTAMVAKRFQVELTGDGVDMSTLEQDLGSIDLGRLESMKNQGAGAK
jgi:Yip1 domain